MSVAESFAPVRPGAPGPLLGAPAAQPPPEPDRPGATVRLLMVAPNAMPGGSGQVFLDLAERLPAFGVEVRAVVLRDGPLVERLRDAGVEVVVIPAGRLRNPFQFLRTTREIGRIMRDWGVQVVYANDSRSHVYVAGGAWRRGLPTLWYQPNHPAPVRPLDRLATLAPSSAILAVSEQSADAQRRVWPGRAVRLVHPGIDVAAYTIGRDEELRATYGIPLDAPLVSIVARLQSWKGQREFLTAAALVAEKHQQAYFAVVGGPSSEADHPYEEELVGLAQELGIAGKVIFTGHVEDVPRWMAASNVMVNASDPEPFGLVLVEAMASGCPVVAVDKAGPHDIVTHSESGLLCEAREPLALAAAVTRLLDDGALREQMGIRGRDRAVSLFSRDSMTERFVHVMHAVRQQTAVG